jgi:hypothetical protein
MIELVAGVNMDWREEMVKVEDTRALLEEIELEICRLHELQAANTFQELKEGLLPLTKLLNKLFFDYGDEMKVNAHNTFDD